MTVCKNAPFNLILISKIPLKQIEYFNLLEKAKTIHRMIYMRKERSGKKIKIRGL